MISSGMVLVRSENGQLLMIPQHTLAQMQAHAQSQPQTTMTPRPATPTSASSVQISTVQNCPSPKIFSHLCGMKPSTFPLQVKSVAEEYNFERKPTSSWNTYHCTAGDPDHYNQASLTGTDDSAAHDDVTAAARSSASDCSGQYGTNVSVGNSRSCADWNCSEDGAGDHGGIDCGHSKDPDETMENVKKCKNFLSTLIKLASSGKQSTETAANVKELVQNLLDGKIEAEDFTSRLYRELNSSPQPYLVPFLKRSLPALRQLTPDSAAFIQQSQQQQPTTQPTTTLTAVMLNSPIQRTAGKTTATVTSTLQQPVISLTQPTQVGVGKQGQPTQVVIQQSQKPGTLIRPPQVTLTQTPMVALRPPHNRIMLTAPQQIQLNPLQTDLY
ncbi:UNVERIFIED_CONTAM: hypothetical protein K2H54_069521 [Gekko kuhli]